MLARVPHRPADGLTVTMVAFDLLAVAGADVSGPAVGAPPPDIKERFPDIVPDQTRVFERPMSGRLPVLRYGWALIRPQAAEKPAAPEEGKK